MTSATRTKHSILKPLAFSLGATMVVLVLLVGGWLLWVAVRPPPEGFAPTTGEAAGVAGQTTGGVQYTVDARSREEWAYFSFADGRAVATSQESLDWDLAFRRTDNLTNGGETNPQGLGGAVDLGDIPLEEASPPAAGYLTDATDDESGLENPALNKWYSYNWTTHVITSKNHTYALRTAGGELALLTFVSYYCDDGSSGCITFSYLYPAEP
ncbi:MAG: HmuY family protein [Dehalococcoidia bacterium]